MLKLEVRVDFSKLVTGFAQVPFATALALTRTAQDAQAEVRRQLPSRFIIRNSWVSGGIRITPATKTTLEAAVYSRDRFMILQETGGTKTPLTARNVAVPEGVRTNKRGLITQANRPRALLSKPRTFIATIGGIKGIWQRTTKKRVPLKLLYALVPSVNIPARFEFENTVRAIVESRFGRQFRLAFQQALRTAR